MSLLTLKGPTSSDAFRFVINHTSNLPASQDLSAFEKTKSSSVADLSAFEKNLNVIETI